MIFSAPQSINSRNVKRPIFDIIDFGCASEIFLVLQKLSHFKDGASCVNVGAHLYDGYTCHFFLLE
jgi:hypothetical protein